MSDRIFAGIWLLLCIGGMFVAWQIHSEYSYEPVGPRPFEWLGFPVATAILTMVIGILFNASLPAAGISGVVMGIFLWYAFDRLLDVTLPPGAWLN